MVRKALSHGRHNPNNTVLAVEDTRTGQRLVAKLFSSELSFDKERDIRQKLGTGAAVASLRGTVLLSDLEGSVHDAWPVPAHPYAAIMQAGDMSLDTALTTLKHDDRLPVVFSLIAAVCWLRGVCCTSHLMLFSFSSLQLRALVAMHKANYIMADFKPGNVVRVGLSWRLIDLDACVEVGIGARVVSCTPAYMAPEAAGEGLDAYVPDVKFDAWSAGMVLLHVLLGGLFPVFSDECVHGRVAAV